MAVHTTAFGQDATPPPSSNPASSNPPAADPPAANPAANPPVANPSAANPSAANPSAANPPVETPPEESAKDSDQDVKHRWLDKTHQTVYDTLWRSAEHVDRWFGSVEDETVYQQIYGSFAPALIYTQYDHLKTQARFNVNFPLPQINERIHAFVGRFDPNEFITERDEPSGSIPRTYGPPTQDQTLLGIGYHQQPNQQGGRFEAGTGIRVTLPMDPYVKGSYVFERGRSESGMFSVRETLFWQRSEGAGETTRLDMERIFDPQRLLIRYTLSGTRSQKSEGVLGYTTLMLLHSLTKRRAVAFAMGADGQTQAQVKLHDFGFKAAYRQGILRRWLILEVRTSLDWPKDFRWQQRHPSLGVGVGFEMLIGTEQFLARPVTF